jgi:BirA family biotin operon repressor/biotin-[acetyl-CoA-carboxylase] ligase
MDFRAYVAGLRAEPLFRSLDVVAFHTVDSTNPAARRLAMGVARRDLPVGRLLVTAWTQSQGRGRRGRPWSMHPGGGVACSLLTSVEEAQAMQALPLAVTLALCRRLEAIAGEPCRVKWPNDIQLRGRKLAGILIEAVSPPNAGGSAVIGFGVNRLAPGVAGAAALDEVLANPPELSRLTALLVEAVLSEIDRARPLAELVDEYRTVSAHRPGEPMRWKTAEGEVEGTFLGFDPHGLLQVSVNGEERRMAAADLIEA